MPAYLFITVFIWLDGSSAMNGRAQPDSLLRNRLYTQWQAVRYRLPDSSLYYATQLHQLARKTRRDADLAQSLMTLGIVERDRGNYAEAVSLFQQALPHGERLTDHDAIGSIYQNMALTYKRMGDSQRVTAIWEQALGYAEKAYSLFKTYRSSPGNIANAQNTMAIIQRDLEQFEKARQNYQAAIELLEPIQANLSRKDLSTLAILYGNLGQLLINDKKYDQSISLISKALVINTSINQLTSLEHNRRNLAKAYRLQKNLPESAKNAQKAIEYARQIGDPHRLFNTLSVTYETYSDLGDYKQALDMLKEQKLIEDSLMRVDKARQILALQAQYDNERTRQLAEVTAQKDRLLAETKARLLLQHEGDLARIDADKTRDLSRMSARAELDKEELRSRYASASNQQKIRQLGAENSRQSLQVLWLSIGACLFCLLSGLLLLLYRRVRHSRAKIQTQSEQMKLLMRELHHRVKNNLAVVSGLLELQANRLGDAPIRQAFVESQQRIQAMSLIHQRLYQTDTTTQINLTDYTHSLIDSLMAAYGYTPNQLERKVSIEVADVDVDIAIPLGLILNELLTNAFKYAFPNAKSAPRLTVRIWHKDGLNLLLADNGPGLNLNEWKTEQTLGRNTSFGRRLIHSLSDQIGASMDVDVRQGTCFTLHIPTHLFQMN
ncbi:tetratricopeptide repeat protein [Fibrella forsythiae]|uniref:histidine kinase n=1 Tax=Fibrella forsythiae TaxID=2817061 RepID=A0ABS3JG17_9BACT|nr:tetratricopeptide repeat protein [Fibrella forsythiae]MBO0948953.1 tetratricopeptide repeat protein [Fibrella forsythiae]